MKNITDIGIIIAALLVGAAIMFANSKDLTGWLFVFAGVACFVKFIYIKTDPPSAP